MNVADPDTMAELETVERPCVASVAARVGDVRLIDSLLLEVS